MTKEKKNSWDYQKGRYKQVNIKFFVDSDEDMLLYHFLTTSDNRAGFIKKLIKEKMWEDAYNGN